MPTVYQLVAQALVRSQGEDGESFEDIVSFVKERRPVNEEVEPHVRAALKHGVEIGLLKMTDPFHFLEERYCIARRS